MKFTVIVTDENGLYDFITIIEAMTSPAAKLLALNEAAREWSTDTNALAIRGVIAGEPEIIEWHDDPVSGGQ